MYEYVYILREDMAVRNTKRRQQAENTKAQIFTSALELLNEHSYDKITVRDIVNRARVSIGCFYKYYNSKLDVYYDTYHQADEYFDSEVAPALLGLGPAEAVLLYFDYYARYSFEITSLALTKLLYCSDNKSFERRSERGMRSVLEGVMRRGLESGELTAAGCASGAGLEIQAADMADFFLIAVRGLVYNWCSGDGAYDLRVEMSRYVSRLLRCFTRDCGGVQ